MFRTARPFLFFSRLALLPVLFLGLALPLATAAEGDDPPAATVEDERAGVAKEEARKAMEAWLHLIDTGEYIPSWKTASQEFRHSVSAGRWAITCKNVRRPTGELMGRTLEQALYHTEYFRSDGHRVAGEMVTFIFHTQFRHLAMTEAVILRPTGSQWQVVSYSLKPRFE